MNKVIKQNASQLMNIEQGLGLLHSKLMDRLNDVHPLDARRDDLKTYYKEKINEVSEQIKECKRAISE